MANIHDINQVIDAIVKRAPELHAAGVASLAIGEVSVTLAPRGDAPPTDARGLVVEGDGEPQADAPPPPPVDPLNDPATYAGGRIPGFKRPAKQ